MSNPCRVATGLDALAARRFETLRGRRVGLIANPTSVDASLRHLADLLAATPDVRLSALFGPEHGIRGDAQDMIGVASGLDPATGVPEYSLYGADERSLAPTDAMLDGLDLLIFDIQDVGSRFYTFAATMLYAMRAAARRGLGFLVLDRPNPIGGLVIEGPIVQDGFSSFVGAYPLPIRHGMTVGELARMFRDEERLDLELEVVPCPGWSRSMLWADTGLPWVLPSPNMPTPDTALVYPGGCLIEGTNLSEGRGTTRPFELWGSPWLGPDAMASRLAGAPGVLLRPCGFRPTFHKHAGALCRGLQPHVTDARAFRPASLYAAMIAIARDQMIETDASFWRTEPYEFIADPIAIDLLFGSSRERILIESIDARDELSRPEPWRVFERLWAADVADFDARRRPYLLYE
jgi:uncharacterized protein YbbC (DUF1343 family)